MYISHSSHSEYLIVILGRVGVELGIVQTVVALSKERISGRILWRVIIVEDGGISHLLCATVSCSSAGSGRRLPAPC